MDAFADFIIETDFDIAKIDPAENLEGRANKIEAAIKKAPKAVILASRTAKKP